LSKCYFSHDYGSIICVYCYLEFAILFPEFDNALVHFRVLGVGLGQFVVLDGGKRVEVGVDVFGGELADSRSLLRPVGHVAQNLRRAT
jgi:hypothetical protein